MEQVETLVIGAGQAGLAMSEQLSRHNRPHLLVERHRIAERWRSERWDGLHLQQPFWSLNVLGGAPDTADPDAFPTRNDIVDYLAAYAQDIAAPVRCGVAVHALRRAGHDGFLAETPDGPIRARNVVVATGPFQRPAIPALIPHDTDLLQIHASAYRNPAQLPDGAVLVVGSGASGAQIAEELLRAGRRVYLSIGRHARPPRRYRGQDFVWWMRKFGKPTLSLVDTNGVAVSERAPMAVTGAYGGHTIDFRAMALRGLVLLGRVEALRDGIITLAPDLAENLAMGDASYRAFIDAADRHAAEANLDLPDDPEARTLLPAQSGLHDPVPTLDLGAAGIGAIVWATGYALDFGWIDIPVFDDHGAPVHNRGVTEVPGLYFLGLEWLTGPASAFLVGSRRDATELADHLDARMRAEGKKEAVLF